MVSKMIFVAAVLLQLLSVVLSHSDHTLLLLISFDGFRYDYLKLAAESGRKTPNFDELRAGGVDGLHVKNRFITKTFPNHYSIATGYDEESHGVTGNNFFDNVIRKKYSNDNMTDPLMWNNGTMDGGAEPVWVTNEKAAHSTLYPKRSGVIMWPGADAELHGKRPTYHITYNGSFPFEARVDKMMQWFSNEEKPINLGLLYFQEPDGTGHKFGPDSDEVLDKVVEMDKLVGYILKQLKKHRLLHRMNIIVTSDHGMAETPYVIQLDEYVDSSWYQMYGGSPVLNIDPIPGKEEAVYNALNKIEHLNVYKKEEIPREYFYTWNNRIQPIVIAADLGYNIIQSAENTTLKGNHGYNNSLDVMHPFFIAHGPAFKKNYTSEGFRNIDIYPLMCHILDIKPYPNNGSLDQVRDLLYVDELEGFLVFNITILTFLLAVGFAALVSGVFCISAFRSHRILLRRRRPLTVRLNNIHDGHTRLLSNSEDEEEDDDIP